MKRIFAMFMLTLFLVAAMAVTTSVAFAQITESGNRGHPNTNPTGKCPPGQNQDATPGALKKCNR